MVIDGFNSEWAPVTSGIPQGSFLGPVLFIIYINDLDDALSNRISKFAIDTKIGNSVLTDGDKQILQVDCIKFQFGRIDGRCPLTRVGKNPGFFF